MSADANEPEVKDVGISHVEPAGDDEELVDDPEQTDPESSPEEEAEGAEEETPADPEPDLETTPPAAKPTEIALHEVPGETPRERAMRREITRLRNLSRQNRTGEIITAPAAEPHQVRELAPEKKAILERYNPEELTALREVVDVLAEDMGLVRKDQLNQETYVDRANTELNSFLDKHPEYLPENDKDGTLWGAFKTEYALYKQPTNPKDFAKIFDRVHRDVFGVKPAGALPNTVAQQAKKNVASHTGASAAAPASKGMSRVSQPQGVRLDMLKGFSDDELAEFGAE